MKINILSGSDSFLLELFVWKVNKVEYNGDLNNKHLNNWNIWIADFLKSCFQIIIYSDARFLLRTGQENVDKLYAIQIAIQIKD